MIAVTTQDRVKKVLSQVIGVNPEEISEDVHLADEYCMDSLDTMDLMFQLEIEFDLYDLEEPFQKKQPQTVKEMSLIIQEELSIKFAEN